MSTPCKVCDGDKRLDVDNDHYETCYRCDGSGLEIENACQECGGNGTHVADGRPNTKCDLCNGSGREQAKETLSYQTLSGLREDCKRHEKYLTDRLATIKKQIKRVATFHGSDAASKEESIKPYINEANAIRKHFESMGIEYNY